MGLSHPAAAAVYLLLSGAHQTIDPKSAQPSFLVRKKEKDKGDVCGQKTQFSTWSINASLPIVTLYEIYVFSVWEPLSFDWQVGWMGLMHHNRGAA